MSRPVLLFLHLDVKAEVWRSRICRSHRSWVFGWAFAGYQGAWEDIFDFIDGLVSKMVRDL